MEVVVGILGLVVGALVSYFVARWQVKRSERMEETRRREEEYKEEARRTGEETQKEKQIIVDFLVFLDSRRLLGEGASYGDYSSPEIAYDAVAEIYRRLTEFRAQLFGILFPEEWERRIGRIDISPGIRPFETVEIHVPNRLSKGSPKQKDVWDTATHMQGQAKSLLMYVENWIPPTDKRLRADGLPHGGGRSSWRDSEDSPWADSRRDDARYQRNLYLEEFQEASDQTRRALCEAFDLCHASFCERFC
jgi:hypothetical protein